MTEPRILLALGALERGNVTLAIELLRDVAGESEPPMKIQPAATQRAMKIPAAAEAMGYSAKKLRSMIARGDVPVIGSGRATRVLVDEAIETLRRAPNASTDEFKNAGAAWAARRGQLRVVEGGEGR